MALGIPAIASPVGVNNNIIQDRENGFLCHDIESWRRTIENLIADKSLRKQIGDKGRKTIEAHYSVTSNSSNFLLLFGSE
jgi:glycosyltransferase involved in cell wall biosynthesis